MKSKTRVFVVDIDGTLCYGKKSITFAKELISYLSSNFKVYIFSNTSSQTIQDIKSRLHEVGIINDDSVSILTSMSLTVEYLVETNISSVYCVGHEKLCKELKANFIDVVSPDKEASYLVVGLDTGATYQAASCALNILLQKQVEFIACNSDMMFPVTNSQFAPGAGILVEYLAKTTKKVPLIIGKPSTYLLHRICIHENCEKEDITVIGDSYELDVVMAKNFGCNYYYFNPFDSRSFMVSSLDEIYNHLRGLQ